MADNAPANTAAKIVGVVAALAAAWAARKALSAAWKAITGHEPPDPEEPGNHRFGEVVLAAALTGAVVGVARVVAAHQAARLTATDDDHEDDEITA